MTCKHSYSCSLCIKLPEHAPKAHRSTNQHLRHRNYFFSVNMNNLRYVSLNLEQF